ncbi:MAG: hypothetical protein AAF417_22585 [Pseudomonadota bacterium]
MAEHEGLTRRQRYWAEHIEAASRSGTSLKAYADANGLEVQSLYRAKSYLRSLDQEVCAQRGAAATLIRVQATPSASDVVRCRIAFANGTSMEVECPPGQWSMLVEGVASLR